METQRKKIPDETFPKNLSLVNKALEAVAILVTLFETLAIEKAKSEKEHLVMDDDYIKMLGMIVRSQKNPERTYPLDRARFNTIRQHVEAAKNIVSMIEPKKEEAS